MDYFDSSYYNNYYATNYSSNPPIVSPKVSSDVKVEDAKKRNNKILRISLGVVSGLILLAFLVIILAALLIPAHNSEPLPPTVTPPISVPTSVTLWM